MEFLLVFAFLALFSASALVGIALRKRLHERHLTSENMDSIRLVTGLMVTFAALILSLQLSTARSRFDVTSGHRSAYAARLANLDQCLRLFKEAADPLRLKLRQYTAAVIASTWPHEAAPEVAGMPDTRGMAVRGEDRTLSRLMSDIGADVDALPTTGLEHSATRCRAAYAEVSSARWNVIEDAIAPSGDFFVGILSFWLSLVFLSFGLQIPRRALSAAVLIIGVLSVSSIMFVIVDLGLPYQGVFHVPSAAMREALADMVR
ncbi:bestrophin-like domain [Bosea sp. NPDC055332]